MLCGSATTQAREGMCVFRNPQKVSPSATLQSLPFKACKPSERYSKEFCSLPAHRVKKHFWPSPQSIISSIPVRPPDFTDLRYVLHRLKIPFLNCLLSISWIFPVDLLWVRTMLKHLKIQALPMVFAADLWTNGRQFHIRINGQKAAEWKTSFL